jgi:dynein heavy chain, axonemal
MCIYLQNSEKDEDVPRRLQKINDHFAHNLYVSVCRSLFEKDKLLFSALLAIRILMSECLLSEDSVAFLLTGGVGIAEAKVELPQNRYLPGTAHALAHDALL